ncbi:MAG: DUF3788 family protein [Candidatus Eisenbacteria bacterium]|nr:DUF3788 family protein [Candidatus Eisenbacteria bacterium]
MPNDRPVLNDPDQFPTEEVVFSHIGKRKVVWEALFGALHERHPEFEEEWRYYKDGKSWLMKVTRKSKTIFWVSVRKNAFLVAFYFSDRAEERILKSVLSEERKEEFKSGKKHRKIRPIAIRMEEKKDIEDVEELIGIRMNV